MSPTPPHAFTHLGANAFRKHMPSHNNSREVMYRRRHQRNRPLRIFQGKPRRRRRHRRPQGPGDGKPKEQRQARNLGNQVGQRVPSDPTQPAPKRRPQQQRPQRTPEQRRRGVHDPRLPKRQNKKQLRLKTVVVFRAAHGVERGGVAQEDGDAGEDGRATLLLIWGIGQYCEFRGVKRYTPYTIPLHIRSH